MCHVRAVGLRAENKSHDFLKRNNLLAYLQLPCLSVLMIILNVLYYPGHAVE
jgi:hypothetical protein